MFRISESNSVLKLKNPNIKVRTTIPTTAHLFFSNETPASLVISTGSGHFFDSGLRVFTNCGKKNNTKAIVPTKSNEANRPKSCNAGAFSGTKHKKAPTVVTLPTTKGPTISFKADLGCSLSFRWSIKCNG